MNELLAIVRRITQIILDTKEDMKDELGDLGVKIIKERTRDGFGVKNGRRTRLAPLKAATKKRRLTKELSPETSVSKSNLTETGQMLNSLRSKKLKNGVKVELPRTEEILDKAINVQKKRPFMCFSEKEEQQLTNRVAKELTKRLKNLKIG